jgi:hypothetical protein
MTRTIFGRDATKDEIASALIYKLQRKKPPKSNDQFSTNDAYTEDTSISFQLLVMWGYDVRYEDTFTTRALLIKHSNTITWN